MLSVDTKGCLCVSKQQHKYSRKAKVSPDIPRYVLVMLTDVQLHVGSRQILDLASTHDGIRYATLFDCLLTFGIPEHALLCPKKQSQIQGLRLIDPCSKAETNLISV